MTRVRARRWQTRLGESCGNSGGGGGGGSGGGGNGGGTGSGGLGGGGLSGGGTVGGEGDPVLHIPESPAPGQSARFTRVQHLQMARPGLRSIFLALA